MKRKSHIESFLEHTEKLNISGVSESKYQTPKIGTKVKLTESIGREYVHPNDAIFIGSVGTIIEIDSDGTAFLVDFGPADGYKIVRKHWLYEHEFEIYSH